MKLIERNKIALEKLKCPDEMLLECQFQKKSSARPFILICPGGGYDHLAIDKEGWQPQKWLESLNYHTGILYYQVQAIQPKVFLDQLAEIIRYLKNHPAVSHLFLLGFSAGGHVAGLTGTKDFFPKADGLLLCYPVVTMDKAFTHPRSCQNFAAGKNLTYSIEEQADSDFPPTFLWHTVADQTVPVANSLILVDALIQKEISTELHPFPDGPHGLGILSEWPQQMQWKKLAEQWLQAQIN